MGQAAMSLEPNIIVVGASARAVAFSALRAGMRPYAIDLFADSDLADACPAVKIERYPSDFERAMAHAPQIPWMYTGGLENYPDLVDRMAALRPLLGNGAGVLREIRNPELLSARLASAGFTMPEIRSSPPESGSEKQWLLKPRRSSAGLGIRRANSADRRVAAKNSYFQQFIPGASRSAVFVAQNGDCELLGVTSQHSGVSGLSDEPFLYAGSAVFDSQAGESSRLKELGEVLTRDFALRGLFNVDYVHDGRQIWPLEVNPRYSASMEVLEYSLGKNILALHLAEFESSPQFSLGFSRSPRPRHVVKRIVYAARACTVTPGLNQLRSAWNVEARLPSLADIPRSGDRILRGQPVATVIVDGASPDEVERVLVERVKAVEQTLSTV
jgi:uncharacterized protein